MEKDNIEDICRSLINFFVRRNVTNKPTYNKLDQIFIDFIQEINKEKYSGVKICNKLTEKLQNEVGKDFENILRNENAYDNFGNENVYFILTKLAENGLHDKSNIDFWKQKDKRKPEAWNIEHILPQNIKDTAWKKVMINWAEKNSDKRTIDEIHKDYVNKLGNLTLTQYNSEMGNKPFIEKLNLTKGGKNIGYKNELAEGLNKEIIDKAAWTPDEIDARTEILIENILNIFKW